jgi:uncharacterized protein YjbJ (UPF0337 family)
MSSSNEKKVTGNVNAAVGKAKEIAGNLTNNPRLQTEGQDQKAKGDLQKAVGSAQSTVEKGLEKAGNLVKKAGEKIKHAAD